MLGWGLGFAVCWVRAGCVFSFSFLLNSRAEIGKLGHLSRSYERFLVSMGMGAGKRFAATPPYSSLVSSGLFWSLLGSGLFSRFSG